MRISLADGGEHRVRTITTTEAHIGNKIAEGWISEAEGWRSMAVLFRGQREAARTELSKLNALPLWRVVWQRLTA